MGSENEDQCLVPKSKPDDPTRDFDKKSKFSYTIEFLFSFAELDTCKKLPVGFDSAILRELDDQSTSLLDSNHDSDASRFQSSLSHCTWRNPEQGLLGSGALARVHTSVAETSFPVVQGSGFQVLNRSSQPYRHPHLCKTKYYSGRESLSKDHYNDETFGTPDNLSQVRAELEKMRRDSFEFMRKQQEMATQEKKKIFHNEQTENSNLDIAIILEDAEVDKKVANKHSKSRGSEHFDVKGHPENPLFCSSDLTHQLHEGEKKPAADQKVIEHDSTHFPYGTSGFVHNLVKSAPNPVAKEISMELHGRCNPVSCECLEEHILSENNGYYSNKQHLIKKRSSYDVDESQSNSSSYDAASQHLLSLLHKGAGFTDLVESSKLNMWSLDKPYVSESETEIDSNQLNKSGRSSIKNFEKNLHGPDSRMLVRDSQSTSLSGTLKDLTSRSKWDDPVESQFSVESGSIGDVEGIEFSSFVKQIDLSKSSSDVLMPNIQAKVEFDLHGRPGLKHSTPSSFDELDICLPDEDSLITVPETKHSTPSSFDELDICLPDEDSLITVPESKHSTLSSFDELDICLPDEDSLITVDDYTFPQEDSLVVAAEGTSSAPVNTFGRSSDCDLTVSDNRFDLAGFQSPTSFHASDDVISSDTCFSSLCMQQYKPHLHHSQLKPAKAQMSQPESQQSHKGSRIKPRDFENYAYNLHSLQYFPTHVHLNPSLHLQAAATGFDHFGNPQLLQELSIPNYSSTQQLYGLPRLAFPQRTSDELACYAQDRNKLVHSSLNFDQQYNYNYLENASSRPLIGGNNLISKLHRKSDTGIERKANALSHYSPPCAENIWQTS